MKKASLALLMAISPLLPSVSALAQNVAPTDTSRPVISPGKAGAGMEGVAPPASPALNVTVAEIMSRPGDFAGRNVTVTSPVEEVLTPWTVKLDEDRVLSGGIDNDILVVGKTPLVSLGFNPAWIDKQVRVTGTVRVLQAEDFRREYGRGVDDRMFRRYEGKPAIIAHSMTIVDKSAVPSSGASGASGAGNAGTNAPAKAAPARNSGNAGRIGLEMECRPSSVHCPVTDSSGSSVITTDSLPIGSAPDKDSTITESQYPTSPGSGSMGSGVTGSPTGPAPGPTNGIGR
ncbi:hypothetical protein [Noviherbaspirillum sp. ST9]|uniref:hypothetical protein n=1 Tax=Noviherbaspirillum sp. ST9 TaxID=3401606 RepID=UPI003B58AD6C